MDAAGFAGDVINGRTDFHGGDDPAFTTRRGNVKARTGLAKRKR